MRDRPGCHIALVGSSGSGKSTLLHLMAGLDDPTLGEITWPAIGGAGALRPGPIAMIFQGPSLLPPLTVVENVALPLTLGGTSAAKAYRVASDALGLLDLGDLADALPEEISGGQAQRVAIARALAVDPPLLLMDEPTASLDPARRGELGELLRRLMAEGRTLVVATHDEEFARSYATRVVRLADGIVTTQD